jgi:hypothetical protein
LVQVTCYQSDPKMNNKTPLLPSLSLSLCRKENPASY